MDTSPEQLLKMADHLSAEGAMWAEEAEDLLRALAAEKNPIDMVLHCPACGMQHIDEPEQIEMAPPERPCLMVIGSRIQGELNPFRWTNPPHRSHLCHGCGHVWRPADVPTNGVAAVKTKGKADTEIIQHIDLDRIMLAQMREAARESKWMPDEYLMNDWVSDVCRWLRAGPTK